MWSSPLLPPPQENMELERSARKTITHFQEEEQLGRLGDLSNNKKLQQSFIHWQEEATYSHGSLGQIADEAWKALISVNGLGEPHIAFHKSSVQGRYYFPWLWRWWVWVETGSILLVLCLQFCLWSSVLHRPRTYMEALFSASPGCWTSSSFLPCFFCWWSLSPGCLCSLCLSTAPGSPSCMNQPGSCCSLDLGSSISSLEVCDHILTWFLGLSMAMCTCEL